MRFALVKLDSTIDDEEYGKMSAIELLSLLDTVGTIRERKLGRDGRNVQGPTARSISILLRAVRG